MGEARKGTIISKNKINFEKRIYTNFQEGDESEILKWEKTKLGPLNPVGQYHEGESPTGPRGVPQNRKKMGKKRF